MPRPAAGAFQAALGRAAPKTGLAAAQAVWAEAVGEQVAAVARPVSERSGVVTVVCSDPIWAEELDLMQGRLLESLEQRLGAAAPRSLHFRVERAGD
jgi:predicted nucleic acid-binding Zn ribbon protein